MNLLAGALRAVGTNPAEGSDRHDEAQPRALAL